MRSLAFGMMGLGAVVIALAGGCNSTNAPGSPGGDTLAATSYPQIAVLEGLDKWLVIGRPPVVTPGPPMQVNVALRSRTESENINVQYRFFFFDAAGNPKDANPTWRYKNVQSRTETHFQGGALDRDAASWRLEVRPAKAMNQ